MRRIVVSDGVCLVIPADATTSVPPGSTTTTEESFNAVKGVVSAVLLSYVEDYPEDEIPRLAIKQRIEDLVSLLCVETFAVLFAREKSLELRGISDEDLDRIKTDLSTLPDR